MVTRTIPTPGPGVYQAIVRREFDAGFHRLRFRWNVRVDAWYMDVANDNNERQVYGIRLGTGNDKLRAFKARDVPQGSLNVVDSTGQGVQPTLENFGKTLLLQYVDAVVPETVSVALEQPTNLPGPVPPGPTVPEHAEQHEIGGADLLTITSLQAGEFTAGMVLTTDGTNSATWQLPAAQATIETIQTTETDTTKVLNPDGGTGVGWNAPAVADLPDINAYGNNAPTLGTTFAALPLQVVRGTPDATYFTKPNDDNIQIETTGRYLVVGQASVSPSTSPDTGLAYLQLFIDGSASSTEGMKCQQGYGPEDGTGEQGSMMFFGTISLTSGEDLSLRARYDPATDSCFVISGTQAITVMFIGP